MMIWMLWGLLLMAVFVAGWMAGQQVMERRVVRWAYDAYFKAPPAGLKSTLRGL